MKKKKHNPTGLFILFLLLLTIFLSSCARTTYIQRAGVLPKGKHLKSIGVVVHCNESKIHLIDDRVIEDSFSLNSLALDVSSRWGLGHNLDFGVRGICGGLGLDIKRNIVKEQNGLIPKLALDLDLLMSFETLFNINDFEGGIALSCITDRRIYKSLRFINSVSLKYYVMGFTARSERMEDKYRINYYTSPVRALEECIILELPIGLEIIGKSGNDFFLFGIIPQFYLNKKPMKIIKNEDFYLDVLEYFHRHDVQFILQYSFF